MKTNCKKWKHLLFITAAAITFASIPFYTLAADANTKELDGTDKKQEATSDKMDSEEDPVTTAGAADLLDAEITAEEEALVDNSLEQAEEQKPETAEVTLAMAIPDQADQVKTEEKPMLTAGAANLLDAEIILEEEEAATLMQGRTAQAEKQEPEVLESTLVMAKVNQYVNIRQDADQDSEKVGVLYKDCGGEIVEKNQEWTKITSGDVTGQIKNEYLCYGDEAEELAKDVGHLTAYSGTETLRVRKEASMESGVLGLLANGEAVEAIAEEGDWVSVSYEGTMGYVAAEYVNIKFDIDTAESMESIRAKEEAERARAAAEAEAKRNAQKEAVMTSASELDILAALIQCEAGGEPYEGQVAVGSVVMNRVRSGGYPNSITEVIYASGQFVPAAKGRMESLILTGNIRSSCVQAAQEVINGRCNVGDALHFRRAGNREGLIIGNHVFY